MTYSRSFLNPALCIYFVKLLRHKVTEFTESQYRQYIASAGEPRLVMDAPLLGEGVALEGYSMEEVEAAIEIFTQIIKDISQRLYGDKYYLLNQATYYAPVPQRANKQTHKEKGNYIIIITL